MALPVPIRGFTENESRIGTVVIEILWYKHTDTLTHPDSYIRM